MTSFTSRYGNPAHDHRGAHVWVHERHSCVVVAVSGNLDGDNVEVIVARALRAAAATTALVLDLDAVSAGTPDGVGPLLAAVGRHCAAGGTEWALVAGDPVLRHIPDRDARSALPLVNSVAQAEQIFDEAIIRRRRAVLPLLGRTA